MGMLNIDVVSFGRLAYRIFDELHMKDMLILEDIGKSMVLRKVMTSVASELTVLKGNIRKQGFVGEMKSTVSELLQYHVTCKQLEELAKLFAHQRFRESLKISVVFWTLFKRRLRTDI